MSDLKIWKSTNTLGPKAEVLERVRFTVTPVLTGWALWWQGEAFWLVPLQSVLLGFRLSCLGAAKKLSFILNSEGRRQQRSQTVSVVLHRGQNGTGTENGACWWTATSSLCYLAYSAVRYLETILNHCFLNRLVPFLCAVMLGDRDRDICVQEIHKLFIAIYIFKWQKKISFWSPLSQETEFWSILFMQLTNEQAKRLLYTFVMCRLCDWKRKHYFN